MKVIHRVMAPATGRPPFTMETWVQSQANSSETCGAQRGCLTDYSPNIYVIPFQHHSTNTPCITDAYI